MIDADNCMTLASAFHAYIVEQLRDSSDPIAQMDLAVAVQKGSIAVRFNEAESECDPYHWAGFILHDSWKFFRCKLPS